MKIPLLSTHHYADGRVGEVFESINTSGVSKSIAAESNTMEVNCALIFRLNKHNRKKCNMPPYCLCGVIQVSASPNIHILCKTASFTPCF